MCSDAELQSVSVCCSVLQRGAVYCSMYRRIAVCRSGLQRVVVAACAGMTMISQKHLREKKYNNRIEPLASFGCCVCTG